MNTQTAYNAGGVVNTVKEYANPQGLMEKLHMSKERAIEIALYGGIGFLFGFLFKKCSTYLFIFALCIVGLIALHQFELITVVVNWGKLYQVFGIQQVTVTEGNALTLVWEWIKANMVITLSLAVGFLGGLKLG